MGGGRAMRSAAKVVGIGVNHGLRSGINVPPPAEQSKLRGVKLPVTSVVASQTGASADVATLQRGSQEIDDWEFAGGLEEVAVGGGEPIGRLVFGRIPSMEEAKEATEDLKEALGSLVSSPRSTSSRSSVAANQVSGLSSEQFETKCCVSFDPKANQEPKYAFQALSFLSESTAAQTVVASIACDPNVWNAVLQNDTLKQFLQSQRADTEYQYEESSSSVESPRKSEDHNSKSIGDALSDFAEKIRGTVAQMMNNVTEYIQKIFGPSASASADAKDAGSFFNIDKSAYFVSLAVMVIAIVVLKR